MTSLTQMRSTTGWLVARALWRLERGRRAVELGATLKSADQRLMWLFIDREPRTLRDVAESLGLEQSTVNRQVNAALSAGLLRRYREPGQTARLVAATDEGLEWFQRDLTRSLGINEAALSAIPPAERTRFVEHLHAFADAFTTAAEAGSASEPEPQPAHATSEPTPEAVSPTT